VSRGIHVKTSVLLSRLQSSFPAASSSLAGQQRADAEGGILQLTATSSYSNCWESCLLLTRNLLNIDLKEHHWTPVGSATFPKRNW